MKEILRRTITDMTSRMAVSGYEWELAAYIAIELKDYADMIKITPNGNLIIEVKGKKEGLSVLYGAHLDEVGYIIKSIDADGFLRFGRVGGSTDSVLPGRKVLIKTDKGVVQGVIGTRSTHMLSEEESKKAQTINQSYVDICAQTKEEAESWGIRTGCQMVIDSPCTPMYNDDYLVTKAADCRALCAILIEVIKRIDKTKLKGNHYFVFTAMEEVTTSGLNTVVNEINPDYCYIFDTIPSGDVPDTKECDNPVKLGEGPVIVLVQHNPRFHNYAVAHPALLKMVRNIVAEEGLKVQEFAFTGAFYSTDASGAINSGKGNAVMSISLPRRYSHSPTEIINLNDCCELYELISRLLYVPVNMEVTEWL